MTGTFLDASWQRRSVGKGALLRAVPTRSTVLVGTTREIVDRFHETNRIRRMELKHTQTSS